MRTPVSACIFGYRLMLSMSNIGLIVSKRSSRQRAPVNYFRVLSVIHKTGTVSSANTRLAAGGNSEKRDPRGRVDSDSRGRIRAERCAQPTLESQLDRLKWPH